MGNETEKKKVLVQGLCASARKFVSLHEREDGDNHQSSAKLLIFKFKTMQVCAFLGLRKLKICRKSAPSNSSFATKNLSLASNKNQNQPTDRELRFGKGKDVTSQISVEIQRDFNASLCLACFF